MKDFLNGLDLPLPNATEVTGFGRRELPIAIVLLHFTGKLFRIDAGFLILYSDEAFAGATDANEAPDGILHGCSVEVWERFNVRRPGVEATLPNTS